MHLNFPEISHNAQSVEMSQNGVPLKKSSVQSRPSRQNITEFSTIQENSIKVWKISEMSGGMAHPQENVQHHPGHESADQAHRPDPLVLVDEAGDSQQADCVELDQHREGEQGCEDVEAEVDSGVVCNVDICAPRVGEDQGGCDNLRLKDCLSYISKTPEPCSSAQPAPLPIEIQSLNRMLGE